MAGMLRLFIQTLVLQGQFFPVISGKLRRISSALWCSNLIYATMKKHSREEWRNLIRAEFKGKGTNRYCSATCPICHISYDVEALSSDVSTRALAAGKVFSHINAAHADALTDRV